MFNKGLAWKSKTESLGIAVVESVMFQRDGHIFWLLILHVPLEGRHRVDTTTYSVPSIILEMSTCGQKE